MRYFEFGGGLGDVINDIYRYNCYASLQGAPVNERCKVSLISHNPAVKELFEHWPSSPKMEVREYGYWTPDKDAEMRRKYKLPQPHREPRPEWATFNFHNRPGDEAVLAELPDEYVVFSVSAGTPDRSIPVGLFQTLLLKSHRPVMFVGRTYERNGRREHVPDYLVNASLIDRISLPATLNVVRDPRCKGVVCCHSSISMLAGWENKPQLLLYDEETRKRHFQKKDQWSWYAYERFNVFHATFDRWKHEAEKFFRHIQ